MCCSCNCPASSTLSLDQDRVLRAIKPVYDGTAVYDISDVVGEGKVLVVSHKGSEYHFSILHPDGSRDRVNDLTNQSHWLEDILKGRFPVVS